MLIGLETKISAQGIYEIELGAGYEYDVQVIGDYNGCSVSLQNAHGVEMTTLTADGGGIFAPHGKIILDVTLADPTDIRAFVDKIK